VQELGGEMTFVHRFTPHLTCTMTVRDDPPVNGENFVQKIQWTERPKPKNLARAGGWQSETD
jgi:hypothetical protein